MGLCLRDVLCEVPQFCSWVCFCTGSAIPQLRSGGHAFAKFSFRIPALGVMPTLCEVLLLQLRSGVMSWRNSAMGVCLREVLLLQLHSWVISWRSSAIMQLHSRGYVFVKFHNSATLLLGYVFGKFRFCNSAQGVMSL